MKQLLKSIIIPLFCLFAGGSLLPSAQGAFDAAKMQESSVRIVAITPGEGDKISISGGTGFLINETGNIVTNQHVVDGAQNLFVLRRVGGITRLYKATCEPNQQSKEVDLAVLNSSIRGAAIKVNTMEPKLLSSVFTMGFPGIADDKSDEIQDAFFRAILKKKDNPALQGDGVDVTPELSENRRLGDMLSPSFPSGKVRRLGNQTLVQGGAAISVVDIDINMGHGNSGGPLLDEAGYVIGVVGRGTRKPDIRSIPHFDPNDPKKVLYIEHVTVDVDKVDWGIAESELEKFLKERNISFPTVHVDVSQIGHWNTKQKLLIALACVCAVVAAGIAFFLVPRRQPVAISTPTSVIDEKIRRILGDRGDAAGGSDAAKPRPKSSVESVWDFEIQGPGGFRQNVRLTDADFKRGRGRVVVGRNSDFSDVMVKHESVSRQHLHFELRDSGLVVADRHSSNGTKVNGKSLAAPFRNQSLKEGDRIQFGELTAGIRRGF